MPDAKCFCLNPNCNAEYEMNASFNEDNLINCSECGSSTVVIEDWDTMLGHVADDAVEALVDELSSYGDLEEAFDALLDEMEGTDLSLESDLDELMEDE